MRLAEDFPSTQLIPANPHAQLDGTAKGGAVVSVVDQLGIPVKFIGVGEAAEDLQSFDPEVFAEALFPSVVAASASALKSN